MNNDTLGLWKRTCVGMTYLESAALAWWRPWIGHEHRRFSVPLSYGREGKWKAVALRCVPSSVFEHACWMRLEFEACLYYGLVSIMGNPPVSGRRGVLEILVSCLACHVFMSSRVRNASKLLLERVVPCECSYDQTRIFAKARNSEFVITCLPSPHH